MAIDPVTGGLLSGGLKLLGGLFGKKDKPNQFQVRDNIVQQAQGARDAAFLYGFNPLTMLQNGQSGGAMDAGGAPPLSSAELLTGALLDVTDVVSGEASRRAAANQLELDLGKIKLDQMRDGVLYINQSAAATVGDGLPVLGPRAATIPTNSGGKPRLSFGGSLENTAVASDSGILGVGASVDPVPVMVPTQGSDGVTRMGPNPDGPDLDTAAYALGADAYYRFTNSFPKPVGPPVPYNNKMSDRTGPVPRASVATRFLNGLAWPTSTGPTFRNFP